MPFVKQETIDNLETRATDAERENSLIRGQLATAMASGEIAQKVMQRVEQLKSNGTLESQALASTLVELEIDESEKYRQSLREGLIEQHRAEVARRIRINDGPRLRKELDEVYVTDGTYEAIDAEIEDGIRNEISEQIISEHRQKFEAELTTPEAKDALIASLIEEMRQDGTFERLLSEVKSEIQKQWEDEAKQELRDEITADESTEENKFKEEKKDALRGSTKYKNTRAAIRKTLRTTWTDEVNDLLAEDAKSEELAKLVTERIALEKSRIEEIQSSIDADRLRNSFYGAAGYDMDSVSEGTRVTVYLGEVTNGRLRVNERNSNFMGRGEVNKVDREITMIATSDKGHFCVVSDSLSESQSIYEQKAAIDPDTVITVGRKWIKNGTEVFNRTVANGVRLVFDSNTENSDFTDTYLPVVDLQIGDARASNRPNERADSKAFKGLA